MILLMLLYQSQYKQLSKLQHKVPCTVQYDCICADSGFRGNTDIRSVMTNRNNEIDVWQNTDGACTCDQQATGGIWPQSPVWVGTVHLLPAAGA